MQETPRKGSDTKERILDVAEAAVLEKGFAATSIEELIAAVNITKRMWSGVGPCSRSCPLPGGKADIPDSVSNVR